MTTDRIEIPTDGNRRSVQLTPAVVALEETYDATISASTEITLNASTTFIEVTAIDEGIMMSWGTANATTTSFDEYIAKNTTRQYYVPYGVAAVNFIERATTALLVMIEK